MNVKPKRKRVQAEDCKVPIILVVEDEKDNLLLLSHILIHLNYNFITATKGKDALDLATNYQVDLVLLDLILPDINGFELIDRFKKNSLTQNMPIVAVSALVRKRERDRAMAAGCDDYLYKPYLIEDLQQKIEKHLPQPFWKHSFSQLMKFKSNFWGKPLISTMPQSSIFGRT